jgi:hypothetical protein
MDTHTTNTIRRRGTTLIATVLVAAALSVSGAAAANAQTVPSKPTCTSAAAVTSADPAGPCAEPLPVKK